MKPKASNGSTSSSAAEAAEREKYQNSPPVVYNTAKINSLTLINLKNLLEQYKKELDSGVYSLEFDQTSEESMREGTTGRFVLKRTPSPPTTTSSPTDSTADMIRFPDDLNDALVAFAVNTGDRESRTLGEANLFRIINWNDTSTVTAATNQVKSGATAAKRDKLTSTSDEPKSTNAKSATSSQTTAAVNLQSNSSSSSSTSPNSSTLSFEYIRNLSSLINSILEPKIVKQLTYTGVDVG